MEVEPMAYADNIKVINVFPEMTTQDEWDNLAIDFYEFFKKYYEAKKQDGTITSDSVCCVRTKGA